MAKTAHKAKKSVIAKRTTRKAPTVPIASVKRTTGDKKMKERDIALDFTTARSLPEGDRRIPQSKRVIAFLVDDQEGNELVFHCLAGEIPPEARAALAAE